MTIDMTSKEQKELFANYKKLPFYDEMFEQDGQIRAAYERVFHEFSHMKVGDLSRHVEIFQEQMMKQGITFTLYTADADSERVIPFDMIPRIITSEEWATLEKGLIQRTKAINEFIYDVYHEQNIFKDHIVPRKMIITNPYFCKEMHGVNIPRDVYIPISGIDLIRDENGEFYVLEDNVRTPSGLSYVFKNRLLTKQLFSEMYFNQRVQEIEFSMNMLLRNLRSLAPGGKKKPYVVVLTPGQFNSAYFEHTFLAQQLGVDLVEGRDLIVKEQHVYVKHLDGLKQVDVIYRRIDDDFIDPVTFRSDSVLGVPGLMNVYLAGNVALVNAPGTGIADDKAIYCYVPDMIRYYLNEEPMIKNVPTYMLSEQKHKEYVLENLSKMVVKERTLSGGYGMLIGPKATEEELLAFAEKIKEDPDKYIAQPTIQLSCSPSVSGEKIVPCHIDLRAFIFMGKDTHVIPGGLTRVALEEGSLVVNSSQGGGTKDTWVLK